MAARKRIKREFFLQPTPRVAQDLLGQYLVHRTGADKIIGKIVETEAYIGPHDLASHARHGKVTSRNLAEYMIGGYIYIYLIYGLYWQLNFSTSRSGQPECVLIRALEPVAPDKFKGVCHLANGPGKLCQYMKLNKRYYGLDLATGRKVWLERGEKIPKSKIATAKRVGIDYAGKYWADKLWRFYIKNNPCVSRK